MGQTGLHTQGTNRNDRIIRRFIDLLLRCHLGIIFKMCIRDRLHSVDKLLLAKHVNIEVMRTLVKICLLYTSLL